MAGTNCTLPSMMDSSQNSHVLSTHKRQDFPLRKDGMNTRSRLRQPIELAESYLLFHWKDALNRNVRDRYSDIVMMILTNVLASFHQCTYKCVLHPKCRQGDGSYAVPLFCFNSEEVEDQNISGRLFQLAVGSTDFIHCL